MPDAGVPDAGRSRRQLPACCRKLPTVLLNEPVVIVPRRRWKAAPSPSVSLASIWYAESSMWRTLMSSPRIVVVGGAPADACACEGRRRASSQKMDVDADAHDAAEPRRPPAASPSGAGGGGVSARRLGPCTTRTG